MAPDYERLELLIKIRRDREAEEYVRECLAANPDWAHGYTQLARILKATGRNAEALEAAKTGVAKDARSAFAHAMLGYIHLEMRKLKRAMDAILEALRLEPSYGWAYYLRTRIYQQQSNYKKMLETAVEGLKHCPEDEWLINQKGWAQKCLGRRQDALRTAEEGLRLHPSAAQILNLRGYTLTEIGRESLFGKLRRYRLAEQSLREAVRLDPTQKAYQDNREANIMLWRTFYIPFPLVILGVAWFLIVGILGFPFRESQVGGILLFDLFAGLCFAMLIWFVLISLDDTRKLAWGVAPLDWLGVPRPPLTQRQRRWGVIQWLIGGFLMAASILLALIRHLL